jgi:trigger factor
MQVTVERTQPCQAKVSLTVPAQELDLEFRKALREAGRKVRMKGFRPGHVPPEVVERFQGKELLHEVAFRFVQKAYQQAVEDEKLKPLGNPRFELGDVAKDADFERTFELDLRPDFELADYEGLEIESTLPPVLDEELEQAIEQACRNQARPEPAGEGGVPEDGLALARVELVFEGATVWERDGLRLTPTRPLPGIDPEVFKGSLAGKRDGETVELPLTFPADFEHEPARGREGLCRIEVKNAFKIVVPSREELRKLLGIETEEELRKRAREGLEKANQQIESDRIEAELLDRVIAAHEMELPAAMIEDQEKSRLASMRQELESKGLSGAELEAELAQREEEARKLAIRGSKAYFVIERIAEKEKLQVTEQEMIGELRGIAKRNNSSFEEVRDFYRQQNLFPQLAMEILERKVRRFLRESAKIVPPKV